MQVRAAREDALTDRDVDEGLSAAIAVTADDQADLALWAAPAPSEQALPSPRVDAQAWVEDAVVAVEP